jgi:hypothetical protein
MSASTASVTVTPPAKAPQKLIAAEERDTGIVLLLLPITSFRAHT